MAWSKQRHDRRCCKKKCAPGIYENKTAYRKKREHFSLINNNFVFFFRNLYFLKLKTLIFLYNLYTSQQQ